MRPFCSLPVAQSLRDARQEAHDRIPSDLRAGRAGRVEVDQVERVAAPPQRHQRVRHAGCGEVPVQELRLLREHVDVQPAVEDQGRRRARGDEHGAARALAGGARRLHAAAEEYFEVVAVIEAPRARCRIPRQVEVGRPVDVHEAAHAGNHLGVCGRGRHLRARRPAGQHEPIAVDVQGGRMLAQEPDGRENVVALRWPLEPRRQPVIDRRHRVSEPREPVVEPARGAFVQPVAHHPAPAMNHDYTRPG